MIQSFDLVLVARFESYGVLGKNIKPSFMNFRSSK